MIWGKRNTYYKSIGQTWKFLPKNGRKSDSVVDLVHDEQQGRDIQNDWLAGWGPALLWILRWWLCDNAVATVSRAGVDSDGFWGRTQFARWVAMFCMAKKLRHSRTGELAQVYAHFLFMGASRKKIWVLGRLGDLSVGVGYSPRIQASPQTW